MLPVENEVGVGQQLRTGDVVRKFDDDLAFFMGSNRPREFTPTQLSAAVASQSVVGIDPASLPPGQVGNQIAVIAIRLVGTRNTLYYSDATVACASFVSTVLQQAGVFADGTFQSYCPTLYTALLGHGAVQIVPNGTRVSDPRGAAACVAGDIILFHNAGTRYKHAMIYVGEGRIVGTSSSRYIVQENRLISYPSYQFYASFRFP